MGGAFVTIFIIIIVLNVLSAAGEKTLKKGARSYQPNRQDGGSISPWGDAQNSSSAQSSEPRQNVSFKKGMQQAAAREAKRRLQNRLEDQREDKATRRKDVADKNRHRIADWGEREGQGFLTIPNVLIAAAVVIIILYISQ